MPGIIPDEQLRKMQLGLPTGYVFHERYLWHDPGELAFDEWMQPCRHWDHPETKRRMHNLICASGLIEKLKPVSPREANEAELCYFHTPEYVRRVKALSAENGGEVGDETTIKKGGYSIAALAAGGAITAVDLVMAGACANAYALVRPPGHHATKSSGGGFCVFNNVVVAAEHAFRRWGDQVKRIAIMDFDAHHGNGTQEAYERDGRVLLVDVHQSNNYPAGSGAVTECGTGEGADLTINVPLPAGSGSAAYASVMHSVVVPAFMAFKPDLIIASCGFDASYMDPLARLTLGSKDFIDITKTLLIQADIHSEGRFVMVHEGGYSEVYVPFCGLAVVETLSGRQTEVVDPMLREQEQQDGGYENHQHAVIEAASKVALRLADRLENAQSHATVRDTTVREDAGPYVL